MGSGSVFRIDDFVASKEAEGEALVDDGGTGTGGITSFTCFSSGGLPITTVIRR